MNKTEGKEQGQLIMADYNGLVWRAIILCICYGVVELAGYRSYVAVLTGVSGADDARSVKAALYLIAYGGFVIGVPVLLIASYLIALWKRIGLRRS